MISLDGMSNFILYLVLFEIGDEHGWTQNGNGNMKKRWLTNGCRATLFSDTHAHVGWLYPHDGWIRIFSICIHIYIYIYIPTMVGNIPPWWLVCTLGRFLCVAVVLKIQSFDDLDGWSKRFGARAIHILKKKKSEELRSWVSQLYSYNFL